MLAVSSKASVGLFLMLTFDIDLRIAITFGDLAMTIPFESSVDTFDMRGDHLREVFEFAVTGTTNPEEWISPRFLQISGKIQTIWKNLRAVFCFINKPKIRY